MQKIKTLTGITLSVLALAVFSGTAYAASLAISQLPEYVTVDHFKLSCTALGGSTTAQFSYKKDGGSYSDFGPAINLTTTPCLVDVTSSQIDSQTKYYFKVTVGSASAETSTTYDVSGPDPVRDYSKDKIGLTSYRIHWTNPGNSDFRQVFIYRGEAPDFSANDDKKVTGIAGTPDTNMSWDDSGLDPNKTYYYIIRALDKAGNSSGLVGDTYTVQGEAVVTTVTPTQGAEGRVTALPKEEGQVLGEEEGELTATPIPTPSNIQEAVTEAVSRFKNSKLLIGIGVLAFIVGLIWYWASSKKRK